jgi:hypothetical protein
MGNALRKDGDSLEEEKKSVLWLSLLPFRSSEPFGFLLCQYLQSPIKTNELRERNWGLDSELGDLAFFKETKNTHINKPPAKFGASKRDPISTNLAF